MNRLAKAQGTMLDLMRGLSAQTVLIGHAFDANGVKLPCYPPDLAVVLFLFISGFLITYSTVAKGDDYTLPEFLIDRGARIFVPYLPVMLLVIVAGLALQLPGPIHIFNVITNLLMLQNYPLASYLPENTYFEAIGTGRPWWTVAVEWWFYCAFGAAYFFLLRRDRHAGSFRWSAFPASSWSCSSRYRGSSSFPGFADVSVRSFSFQRRTCREQDCSFHRYWVWRASVIISIRTFTICRA